MRRPGSFSRLAFPGLLVCGLVLRVLTIGSSWGEPDSDEAMGMLMALRAAHGHLALLFWGGNYGGAGVTWLEAPLVALFGAKIWVFQIVDTALALVAVVLLRSVGRRITTPLAADVAAGTFWFFPALWLFWSEREYVFWLPAIVLALATSLLVLEWFKERKKGTLVLVGLLAGLSIWSYPLVAPLVAPPVVILAWTERRRWVSLGRMALGGVVGIAPWLTYFLVRGSSALVVQSAPEGRKMAFVQAITQVLPAALVGGQERVNLIWTVVVVSPGRLQIIGLAVYVTTVAFTAYAALRRHVAMAACGMAVVLWPAVLAVSHVPVSSNDFRYGLIPVAPLLLVVAHLLSKVRVPAVLAIGALALVAYTTSTNTASFAAVPACNPTLGNLSTYLGDQHRTVVWASYWLSSTLEVCSSPTIVASSVPPVVRDADAENLAASEPRSTYVVFERNTLDGQIGTWVQTHHAGATRSEVAGFAVWAFDGNVSPATMHLNGTF